MPESRHPYNPLKASGIMMRLLAVCGLLLLALSLNCTAVAPVQIGGEHGQDALSMIAFNPFTRNMQGSGDLWSWGGSPMGYGQLFPGQGPSSDFGVWAPFGETPLSYALNETSNGYIINETRQLISGQGQSWSTTIGVNPAEDAQNERPSKLFSSQGFFSGYGDWDPPI